MSEAYEEGRKFFRENLSRINQLRVREFNPYYPFFDNPIKPYESINQTNLGKYRDFERGVEEAKRDYIMNYLRVKDFLEDLRVLCEKHGVEVYGGGCNDCGPCGSIKDADGIEWEFAF